MGVCLFFGFVVWASELWALGPLGCRVMGFRGKLAFRAAGLLQFIGLELRAIVVSYLMIVSVYLVQ